MVSDERIAGPILVDAHVHIHPCFDATALLDAAASNFRAAAARLGVGGGRTGVLLLTDTEESPGFERLRESRLRAGWAVHPGEEAGVLLARKDGRLRLAIAAGHQVVTTDGLEVLALLSPQRPAAGDLRATVSAAQQAGAIAVVPWGFGKWTLRRRRTVEALIAGSARPFFMGDNGGRLRGTREPALLAAARRAGIPTLPGSDPLPFPDQQFRAGSTGFVADVDVSAARPALELRAWLRALDVQPRTFLQGESPAGFALAQLRMQVRKLRRRRAARGAPRYTGR